MSLPGNKRSVSERLDLLLIEILSISEEYILKKEEFLNVYRDGFFDLTTSSINKNSGSITHFDIESDFFPLYKVIVNKENICVKRWESEQTKDVSANIPMNNNTKEETLHLRKVNTKEESSEWIENEVDVAEIAFEQKLCELKKDPLYILNPMPSKSLRSAQKTLQKSLGILGDVCTIKCKLDKLINEYESLSALEYECFL